jgi:hypothetical protein
MLPERMTSLQSPAYLEFSAIIIFAHVRVNAFHDDDTCLPVRPLNHPWMQPARAGGLGQCVEPCSIAKALQHGHNCNPGSGKLEQAIYASEEGSLATCMGYM